MWLERIAGLAFDHWSDARRAVLIAAIAVCTCVAVYQFTVAEALTLAAQFWTRRGAPDCRRNIRICMSGWPFGNFGDA